MDSKFDLNYKSQDFRSRNGIGVKDPVPFKAILRKLNILTVYKPLSSDISGMAGKIGTLSFLLINSNYTIGRQNFTIAHEFYHLFYDEHFKNTIIDCNNDKASVEKKANKFASFLILPDGFIDLISEKEKHKNKISIPTLVKIEQYYQCSRSALLIRLKNLSLIDDEFMKKCNGNSINQAKILGYETALYNKGNENLVIGDYTAMAKTLYDNEIISESNFIDYLLDVGIDTEEIDLNAYSK